jgi:hypothetical protein
LPLGKATVKGNVTVAPGGTLVAESTTVTGNVQGNSSGSIPDGPQVRLSLGLFDSMVGGSVQITNSASLTLIEEGSIGGSLQMIDGSAEIEVGLRASPATWRCAATPLGTAPPA